MRKCQARFTDLARALSLALGNSVSRWCRDGRWPGTSSQLHNAPPRDRSLGHKGVTWWKRHMSNKFGYAHVGSLVCNVVHFVCRTWQPGLAGKLELIVLLLIVLSFPLFSSSLPWRPHKSRYAEPFLLFIQCRSSLAGCCSTLEHRMKG